MRQRTPNGPLHSLPHTSNLTLLLWPIFYPNQLRSETQTNNSIMSNSKYASSCQSWFGKYAKMWVQNGKLMHKHQPRAAVGCFLPYFRENCSTRAKASLPSLGSLSPFCPSPREMRWQGKRGEGETVSRFEAGPARPRSAEGVGHCSQPS